MSFAPRFFLIALALVPLAGAAAVSGGLEAAVEEAFAERFPSETDRLAVRVLRTGGDVAATAPLRVDFPASAEVPRGHTRVDVLARGASGWQKTGWALLYVAHFDSVVVARRTVTRGDAVAPGDLGTAWIETTTFHGTPLRATDLARLGAETIAERRLREGHALRLGDLRPPFATDTGDAVTLRFQRGSITLELPGHAREPGHVGDEIRVYAPDTDATYRARLVAPGIAEWTATL